MYRNEEKKQVIHHLLHYYKVENSAKLLGLIEWFKGDILDLQDVAHAVKNCSAVIHCAGMVSFASSAKNTGVFRAGVKAFWKQNFEAEKNYFEFYKLIN
jgi:nucleoside-diphosphate-sugar epimerase